MQGVLAVERNSLSRMTCRASFSCSVEFLLSSFYNSRVNECGLKFACESLVVFGGMTPYSTNVPSQSVNVRSNVSPRCCIAHVCALYYHILCVVSQRNVQPRTALFRTLVRFACKCLWLGATLATLFETVQALHLCLRVVDCQ